MVPLLNPQPVLNPTTASKLGAPETLNRNLNKYPEPSALNPEPRNPCSPKRESLAGSSGMHLSVRSVDTFSG